MKRFAILIVTCLSVRSLSAETAVSITGEEARRAQGVYKEIAGKFNNLPERPELSSEVPEEEVEVFPPRHFDDEQILAAVERNRVIRLGRKTFALRFIKNDRMKAESSDANSKLTKERRANGLPATPLQYEFQPMALSPSAAVVKAEEYLKHFGIELPSDYRVTVIDFGIQTRGLWLVEWRPFLEGIPYEDFSTPPPILALSSMRPKACWILNERRRLLGR